MTTQNISKKTCDRRPLPSKGMDWLHNPIFNKGTLSLKRKEMRWVCAVCCRRMFRAWMNRCRG